ncbi:hypothetical protein DFP72DRAFT_913484 [Ephemerocybe angulata]|uniref:Uncharacterized protein n=1 Tax=Ephemerocybe angulata TaxID=980116 RepID=A0A8H6M2R2_9AGAR|nr:hypothetical protein DFP72DRAFT_913484 [Tulosesus angulatus]
MSLGAARAGKKRGVIRGLKDETSVIVVDSPSFTLHGAGRIRKEDCKFGNPPFPSNTLYVCRAIYKKKYRATVIAFAGAPSTPFASTALVFTEAQIIWPPAFGDLAPLSPDDERWTIVSTATGQALLHWRSEIGKGAIAIVVGAFREELDDDIARGNGAEAGVEAAELLLDELTFLYGNPDAPAGESALPFQGMLVIRTYTYHIKHDIHRVAKYKTSSAVSALGLCAAAIHRALKLIAKGEIGIDTWVPPQADTTGRATGRRRDALYPAFRRLSGGLKQAVTLKSQQVFAVVEECGDEIGMACLFWTSASSASRFSFCASSSRRGRPGLAASGRPPARLRVSPSEYPAETSRGQVLRYTELVVRRCGIVGPLRAFCSSHCVGSRAGDELGGSTRCFFLPGLTSSASEMSVSERAVREEMLLERTAVSLPALGSQEQS